MGNMTTLTYSLQHILLLKLLALFPFDKRRTIHNFLFLALAKVPANYRVGVSYDFYKGALGVHSFQIQGYLNDLWKGELLLPGSLSLSRGGLDLYYRTAPLLRYEYFPEHCVKTALQYKNNLWRVNHEVIFHPLYRNCKRGRKIVLPIF